MDNTRLNILVCFSSFIISPFVVFRISHAILETIKELNA